MIIKSEEEKRVLQNDADMERFFVELVPYLNEIEKLMRKYKGEEKPIVDIQVSASGYVCAGVYGSGFELTKADENCCYKIRKEYAFTDMEKVG